MNEETKLPDGLQLAIDVLLDESARNELVGAPKSWNAELGGAIAAIRAEHAQRLTLQHHAADQAQLIAYLERAAVKRREISDGVEAELVDECDTLRTLKRMAESERDALRARLAEIEAQEPVAWVPVHPRIGGLWANATASPDPERLPSYPLRSLYAAPVPAQSVPTGERQAVLLTDEQILELEAGCGHGRLHWDTRLSIVRAAERAVLTANNLEVCRG